MAADDLRAAVRALMPQARADLTELVAFKSVADPRQFPAEECHKTAEWVAQACRDVGLADAGLYDTPDGSKAVIAHKPAPAGAPPVLLYCHYDVQPPLDEDAWHTPVWQLTETGDGRWYGRGAADCKGNIVMHLTALRAAGQDLPVGVTLVAEGSEEQGTGGLEEFVPANADLLLADTILVCDSGNFAVGLPTFTETLRGTVNVVVTVDTLAGPMHSGMFGGPAPDALTALIRILGTLHDVAGNTTGPACPATSLARRDLPRRAVSRRCRRLHGVHLTGDGQVADMVWARPALTVLGIDCPPVVGSSAAIQPTARARLNLRIPPGTDPDPALAALTKHLLAQAPWAARVTVEKKSCASFRARTGGPAHTAMTAALRDSYGREPTSQGQGGLSRCVTYSSRPTLTPRSCCSASKNRDASSTRRTRASTPPRSSTWHSPKPCSCSPSSNRTRSWS